MSHYKRIETGVKTSTAAWHPHPEQQPPSACPSFTLATGTWDHHPSNRLILWSVQFDPDDLAEEFDLFASDWRREGRAFSVVRSKEAVVEADVNAIRWHGSAKLLVADSSGSLRIFDSRTLTEQAAHQKHALNSTTAAAMLGLDTSGDSVVTCGEDGRACYGSLERLDSLQATAVGMPGCCLNAVKFAALDATAQSTVAVFASDLSRVSIVDFRSSSPLVAHMLVDAKPRRNYVAVNAIATSPSHPFLVASGDDDGQLCIWDLRQQQAPLARKSEAGRPLHTSPILSVCFHPQNPDYLLSSGIDGTLIMQSISSIALEDADATDPLEHGLSRLWQMPPRLCPMPVNCIDMVDSVAVAGLDSATMLVWRMQLQPVL